MSKLLPCPFCGSNKITITEYDPFDGYQGNLSVQRIWCRKCGVQNERKEKIDVINAWNTRFTTTEEDGE